ARRSAGRAAHHLRAGDQSQDRQGPWVDDSSVAAGPGRPGDRIVERRAFIGVLTGGLLASPLVAEAQQAGRMYHEGVLSLASVRNPREGVCETSLQTLGWVNGRNLILESRYTGSRPEQYVSAAEDFVRLKMDAIVVWSPAATVAVKNATKTIPVVF